MYSFLDTLSESRLIPSTSKLRHFGADELAELIVLYVCALYILFESKDTKQFAMDYAHQTIRHGANFNRMNSGETDLYVMIYGLSSDAELDDPVHSDHFKENLPFGKPALIQWLKDISSGKLNVAHHRALFSRLDYNFRISNTSIRAVRRMSMDWGELSGEERQLTMTRLLQLIKNRASTGEIFGKLRVLAHSHNWELRDVCDKDTGECVSSTIRKVEKKKGSLLTDLAAIATGAIIAKALDKKGR